MSALRPAGDFDRTYEQDMAVMRRPWHIWLTVAAIALILIFPQLDRIWPRSSLSNYSYLIITANRIAYTVVALQGLNILTGMTGQISLGQAAFMLVGGYIASLALIHFGLPIIVTIPLAAIGTGLIGLIFGLPSLRVKGFYLAMATLAAQFIIPWLSRHIYPDLLGGTRGAIQTPAVVLLGYSFGQISRFFYISFAVLLLTTMFSVNIRRTRLGRAFISIRDNDLAAELLGVNPFGYKLRAFFLAAAFAGLAGALKAHTQGGVGTEFGYGLADSIIFLGMIVIGGLGSNLGPFFGAAFVILVDDGAIWLGAALAEIFPGQAAALLTSFRPIFFGLMLMLFLIFEPRGLAHRWELIKASWRIRPFAR